MILFPIVALMFKVNFYFCNFFFFFFCISVFFFFLHFSFLFNYFFWGENKKMENIVFSRQSFFICVCFIP